jgi:hypothetical protein
MADDFGRLWDYRVFSEMWTEPDCPESGRRFLSVHRVQCLKCFDAGRLMWTRSADREPFTTPMARM